jgi:CDP-6-deoxy-D-xylo-4-hexulose-3-dehydrase
MQAAVGCAQLDKLPGFVESRKHNHKYLTERLTDVSDRLILPKACDNSDPSWFGYIVTCREGIDKNSIVNRLEQNGIQTRMLFAGNLTKQPCFDEMRKSRTGYRIVGELTETDRIMKDSFWIGVYPGMTEGMLEYMADSLIRAVRIV